MDYQEVIEKIFSFSPYHKEGLKNINSIDTLLDRPHKAYKIVHVAGTNGKGSVSCKIAKGLELEGFKVGLFTSPHLESFTERIKINGVQIAEADVLNIAEELLELIRSNNIKATFFEFITAMALLYFKRNGVDYAVLETGLGGRLDATNIVDPVQTVITSIAYDHTDVLGATLREIAFEKAGIIKTGRPLILGLRAQQLGIEEIAKERNAFCYSVAESSGDFIEENNNIARLSLQNLGCDPENIKRALKINMPARYEKKIYNGKQCIFDVAHNSDGLCALFNKLESEYGLDKYVIILGMSKNKDRNSMLPILRKYAKKIYWIDTDHPRCLKASELMSYLSFAEAEILNKNNFCLDASSEPIVVCGSCYTISAVKDFLR